MQTYGAFEDSAAAYQAGQLTPEQQRDVSAAIKKDAWPFLLLSGMGALTGIMFGPFLLVGLVLGAGPKTLNDYILAAGLLGFLGLLVVPFVVLCVLRWRNLQEVQAGMVQRATGQVAWFGNAYLPVVPGHNLKASGLNLAPGAYIFTFLPRSGRVVAAERVAAGAPAPSTSLAPSISPVQAKSELLRALASANHFNVDDLPAFRAGQLGSAGTRIIRRAWTSTAWWFLGVGVFLAFLAQGFARGSKGSTEWLLFGVMAIVFGLFPLGSAISSLRIMLEVWEGGVASAEGVVMRLEHINRGRYGSVSYSYVLNQREWFVSSDAYQALIDGLTYRAYFLPRTNKLLALEPIGGMPD